MDAFLPGQMIPSCELLVNRHSGSKVEVFRAELIGAKEPHNYFCIECHPAIAGAIIKMLPSSVFLLCIIIYRYMYVAIIVSVT